MSHPPKRVLITAGPTHEPIDRVRYLGNRSSGRMGVALAVAAAQSGCDVTLLLGPVCASVATPLVDTGIDIQRFQTTEQLQQLLHKHWPQHDVLIMAAAVADYRPVLSSSDEKRPRGKENWQLELEPTPDLLADIDAITQPHQMRIGFALEPQDRLEQSARDKLKRKNLDMIIANPLETMNAATVSAYVFRRDATTVTPPSGISKEEFAVWLMDLLSLDVT